MLDASTKDYLGIFKLLDLLKRVEEYGRTIYWPWVKNSILLPHMSVKAVE